jgi:Fic family protein
MDKYQTFYQPDTELSNLIQSIGVQLADWVCALSQASVLQLEALKLKSIQASLALDHNSLSLIQLQQLAAGKRVVALVQDIRQAKNALALYQQLDSFRPYQSEDLRKAHAAFMLNVTSDAGQYRQQGAGVYEDHKLVHMPPAPSVVAAQVEELITSLQQYPLHPLLLSCLMHFQLASIHPFSDGNGRLCRLWQQLVLMQWHASFCYLPFTVMLKEKSRDYYKSLRQANPKHDATSFILFMLRCIQESLATELTTDAEPSASYGFT